MIPIQNFYTGENAGVILPDADRTARSLKDFYEERKKEGDQRLAQIQEKEKLMLDYSDVSPIQLIASEHQALQALKLDEFNKEASKLNPITSNYVDLMKIKQKRGELEAWQGNLKMNQDAYMRDRAKMATAPDKWKWNKDAWAAEEKSFKDTGMWNSEAAFVRNPGDWRGALAKLAADIFPTTIREETGQYFDQGANKVLATGSVTTGSFDPEGKIKATLEETRAAVKQRALGVRELIEDMTLDFENVVIDQPEVAKRYLDAAESDGMPGLSDTEHDNAILQWGLDQVKLSPVIKVVEGTKEQRQTGFEVNIINGIGGRSTDGKSGYELSKSTVPAQINNLQSAPSINVQNEDGMNISAAVFPKLMDEGYSSSDRVRVQNIVIIGDEFEATVTYPSNVVTWKSATGNKTYPASMVKPTGSSGFGTVNLPDGTTDMVVASKANRTVTASGKFNDIKDLLYSKYPKLANDYALYLQNEYGKGGGVGELNNLGIK